MIPNEVFMLVQEPYTCALEAAAQAGDLTELSHNKFSNLFIDTCNLLV